MGGGGAPAAAAPPRLVGIQLQTSAYGGGVALVYGTARAPGNLIWWDDFVSTKHEQNVGKGGGGGSAVSYTYSASVMLAICEGPIAGIGTVWRDKQKGTLSKYQFTLFTGTRSQSPWSFLSTNHADKAIGYGGTAYVARQKMKLDSNAGLQNFTFEVQGLQRGGVAGSDAQPADIITDLLTNAEYGPGLSNSRIGDLTAYRTYCQAAGLFLSPVLNDQKTVIEHLKELLEATNSDALWSQGVLKLIPYGDTPITGNGATFTPNTTPVYDLGVADFMAARGEDPVKVKRTSQADAFNTFPIEFHDRAQDYNTSVVEDPDPVDSDLYGLRKASPSTLHCIKLASIALQISRIKAQRSLYARNAYEFKLGWRYMLLEPMDLVTLTEPVYGLDHKVVRITKITENEAALLTVEAEEWPFGVASATQFTPGTADGTSPNVDADPGNANTPVIFDGPPLLTNWNHEVWLATSGGALWGGCDVWVSDDNTTYGYAGTIHSPARHGVLSASLASGAANDTTHTLSVDLTASAGTLVSVTAQDKDDLLTECWVDGELLSYQTATLTAANKYDLTTLRRGTHGSAISAHSSGTKFTRLDDSVFHYPVPPSRVGQTLYIKLVSFNVYGGGLQDISTLTPYTFTPTSAIIQPPVPTACTLSLSATKPSVAAGQRRKHFHDDRTYIDDDGTLRRKRWATIAWTAPAINPSTLLTGYRVVLYLGSDPNDESQYVHDPEINHPSSTTLVVPLNTPAASKTINAAVQALYGTNESSWATSSGSVVVDPDTLPMNNALSGNFENLIPNHTSEAGTTALNLVPEGNGLVNDPGNSYAGNWCRQVGSGVTGAVETYFTNKIPCLAGDVFIFSMAWKQPTGTAACSVRLRWADQNGNDNGSPSVTSGGIGVSYAGVSVRGTAPSGCTGVWATVTRAADALGRPIYVDNMSLRRCAKSAHLEDDIGFRIQNAISNSGNTTSDRVWYRGNIDPGTRGGAPNISRCTVMRRRWDTTNKLGRLELKLAPNADTDNLDAMRYAKIDWYRQSAAGSTGTLTLIDTTYQHLPDRLFKTPGTDSDAGNVAYVTAHLQDSGISSGFPACALTLYNAHGPSDTHCFFADTGNADGSALTDNGTAWPAGLTGGTAGGSGGGGGGGGGCPAPWVRLRLANGRTKAAADVRVGDKVWTQHEETGEWGAYPVTFAEPAENARMLLVLEDGRRFTFSSNHRFLTQRGWVELHWLVPGDHLLGSQPGIVARTRKAEFGPVVHIAVETAHTYETDGIVSHNMKSQIG